ncbi:hypothetical protein RBB50_002071 [Rhinocladiella similis]
MTLASGSATESADNFMEAGARLGKPKLMAVLRLPFRKFRRTSMLASSSSSLLPGTKPPSILGSNEIPPYLRWYKHQHPKDEHREIYFCDGPVQRILVKCPSKRKPSSPVSIWLYVLLDTGADNNITSVKTLQEYNLSDQIEWDEPIDPSRRRLHTWLGRDKVTRPTRCTTYDGHQIPVVGKIDIKFKWYDPGHEIWMDKEQTVTFQVVRDQQKRGFVPKWPCIIGNLTMNHVNIGILPLTSLNG